MKHWIYRSALITHIQYGKIKRLIQFVGTLVILLILMSGCTGIINKTPEPYFPVQKEVQTTEYLVLLTGKLVIDNNNYLMVNASGDFPVLIIWPYGYSLKIEGKDVRIINDKGQAVAEVGDTVKLGGGFVTADVMEENRPGVT